MFTSLLGIRNPSSIPQNRTSSLLVQVVSGEQAYNGMSTTVSVINKDIHWPECISIRPYTVSLIGGNITLFGMLVEMSLISRICMKKS